MGSQGVGPMAAEAILAALDPDQRDVASSPLGPMCVLAGAGTGKTRAITHRIAYGVAAGLYPPQRVLALTFTARAAGEMRTRLRALGVGGVAARTFHAAALRQLHYFWPQVVGGAAPEVVAAKAGLVAEAGARLKLRLDRAGVRDLAAEIEWAKVNLLTEETYPAAATAARRDPAGFDLVTVARLLRTYEQIKSTRGVIDFEDVLLLTVGLLAEQAHIAEQIRAQYRYFVVDEYQDVNQAQQRLLELWLGPRHDVCVVGDPLQTIYSFTGASAEHLRTFARRHPGASTVRLSRNYRSTPQIVDLANVVARAGTGGTVRLRAQSEPGPAPTFTGYPDDDAEAAGVARGVRGLIDGGLDPAQIAVLFRTNAQSEAIESALATENIAYLVRGGERFFARPEVREAVLLLRAGTRAVAGDKPLPQLTADTLAAVGWTAQPPASSGASRDRWESLASLIRLAEDLAQADPHAGLRELVTELEHRAAAQHAPTVRGVTLASLHAAKGLEWDAVFLIGCSEGLLPISMADTPESIEEERRLLYVGLTRARRHLRVSMAAARSPGGRAVRRPSRFLDQAGALLGPGLAAAAPSTATRRAGSSTRATPKRPSVCRTCKARLDTAAERKIGRCQACPATYDEHEFERLRTWRSSVATTDKVPAFVVFTDATLIAIAEQRPTSMEQLAAIGGVGPAKLARYGPDVLRILAP